MFKSYIEKARKSVDMNSLKKQMDDCLGSGIEGLAKKQSVLLENAQQLRSQVPSMYGEAEKKWESIARCELRYLIFAVLGGFLVLFGSSLLSILTLIEALRFTNIVDKVIGFVGETDAEAPEKTDENTEEAPKAVAQATFFERVHSKCAAADGQTVAALARDAFISLVFTVGALKIQTFQQLLVIVYISEKLNHSPAFMVPEQVCATARSLSNGAIPECFLYPRVLILLVFAVLNVLFPFPVQAFFVSLYGSEVLLKNASRILHGMKYLTQEPTEGLVLMSAALGASWQIKHPDALPLLLRLVFTLPLCAEWLVSYVVQRIN